MYNAVYLNLKGYWSGVGRQQVRDPPDGRFEVLLRLREPEVESANRLHDARASHGSVLVERPHGEAQPDQGQHQAAHSSLAMGERASLVFLSNRNSTAIVPRPLTG